MFKALSNEEGFLAIPEVELSTFENAKVVIQQIPYEYTSSYLAGSDKGPAAMVSASHYVEFYDEELDQETYKSVGIATLPELDFTNIHDEEAMVLISNQTRALLNEDKFVISLGAEHTVTNGFVRAFKEKYPSISILQIDAHSDLRQEYNNNPYSHASVMARVHDMGVNIVQVGIRAQCKEESELIKSSPLINTWYAHQLDSQGNWINDCIDKLGDVVYVTIDADGFDPSVAPAVGTAEPGGLTWNQGLALLRTLSEKRKIVGFDIVEIAPRENNILTEFTMAKLCYKFLGYIVKNKHI